MFAHEKSHLSIICTLTPFHCCPDPVPLLPKTANGLKDMEAALTTEALDPLTTSLKPEEVELSLPKFTTQGKLDLKQPLQALGIKLAFSDDADFSRLCDKSADLKISKVLHQTFVEVTEAGTEAAAATGIIMTPKGVVLAPKRHVFKADHPFLYAIRHEPSGALLFLGRLTHPQPAQPAAPAATKPVPAAQN